MPSSTALTCPHCGSPLGIDYPSRAADCANGHHFDLAKQGYLNLMVGAATKLQSDTAAMIAHRDAFLGRGHYGPVLEQAVQFIRTHLAAGSEGSDASERADVGPEAPEGTALEIVDLGAGTGYYLDGIAARLAPSYTVSGTGLDLSVPALKRFRARRPGDIALVWDLWRPLPLKDRAFDVALSVFAPRNLAETARILHEDGLVIIAVPGENHLRELRDHGLALDVAHDKVAKLRTDVDAAGFNVLVEESISDVMTLDRDAIIDLIQMGPMAFHHTLEHTREQVHTALAPVTEVQLDLRLVGAQRRRTS